MVSSVRARKVFNGSEAVKKFPDTVFVLNSPNSVFSVGIFAFRWYGRLWAFRIDTCAPGYTILFLRKGLVDLASCELKGTVL